MTSDCVACDFLHGSCFSRRVLMCRRKICYALDGFYLPYLVMILLMRSGDVETNPGPLESTIREMEFLKLAKHIHPSDYTAVGVSLGISSTQLDAILIEKFNNYPNAFFAVFTKWNARLPAPNTNKREVLANILLENDLGDLSQRLRYGRLMRESEVLGSTSSREREGINSVTQEQLDKIAWKFPHAQYYSFCNKLGTEFYEAQNILAKNMNDYHKALMEVLMAWKTRTGGPYSVLEAALRDSEAGALVAHIEPGTSQCTSTSNAVYALRERPDESYTSASRIRTRAPVHSRTDLQPANAPVMQQPEPQAEVQPRLRHERQEKQYFIILVICFALFIFLGWYSARVSSLL